MRYLSHLFDVAPLALAVALSIPAYAQDRSPVNDHEQVDTGVEEEKVTDTTDVEEIEVRGVRYSMELAQDLKMNSDSIIDAIVAEDIGKLPDNTAAESIARIAGVQVTRYNDEANAVLIRGLPDVTTTYNGREFFTAENRRASLQDFPSQALAGIEVYKSGTADLIEPGLAGLVNVRTRRPFDFEGQKIAGGVHYGYNDQSEKSSPSGNILYSNRWDTDAGEFGFLANATYAQSEYYNGARYNATWFPEAQPWWSIEEPYSAGSFVLPATVGLYNESGDRWRPSYNVALQWRPNDELEVYFDGIYQGYRFTGANDNFWFGMTEWDWLNWDGTVVFPDDDSGRNPTDPVLANLEFVEGTYDGQVASVTKSGGLPPQAWRSTHKARTDTYQYALGASWDTESVQAVMDLAFTVSTYTDDAWSFDTGLGFSPAVNADFFGDWGVTFGLADESEWDPTDPGQWLTRGYYESEFDVGGKSWQWRTDLTFDTGWGDWLHTVQTGIRYNDREATREGNSRYAGWWSLQQSLMEFAVRDPQPEDEPGEFPQDGSDPNDSVQQPLTNVRFLELENTFNPFRSGKQGFTSYVQPTIESIQAHQAELVQLAHDNMLLLGDEFTASLWESTTLEKNPANNWLATEKSLAAYLQTKSHFELGSVGVDVFAGVRVIQTEAANTGTSQVYFEGERTLATRKDENDYTTVLPNISFRAQLTEKLQLRMGYTETNTKPNFGDLNPSLNITQVVQNPDIPPPPNSPPREFDAFGSGGNPDLEPLTSKNYDISLEYYFSRTGYVSAAAFYRDLFGFTNWYTRFVEIEPYGTVQLSRPENAGEGEIEGWELNASTFLDFGFIPELLHPFGISANVTFLNGENRLPDGEGNFGEFVDIPGLSKYTYNTAIFYEAHRFSARLSYNARETWVNWYGDTTTGQFAGNKTLQRDRLDFSASFDINDNYSVYVDVANIQAEPFRNYTVIEGFRYPQDVRDEGRYYGAGFRFQF